MVFIRDGIESSIIVKDVVDHMTHAHVTSWLNGLAILLARKGSFNSYIRSDNNTILQNFIKRLAVWRF